MKIKIIVLIIVFLIMGAIPVITINNSYLHSNPDNSTSTTSPITKDTTVEKKLSEKEILAGLLNAQYTENFSSEALKAMAVILQTNYKANKESFDLSKKEVFLSENDMKEKHNNSYEEIKQKIQLAINSVEEIYIYNKGKIAYIPFSKCSSGFTIRDDKYPDLLSVASPWDSLSKNFSTDNKCVGVSIEGMNFLTKNNNGYEKALMWYLPKYEIK